MNSNLQLYTEALLFAIESHSDQVRKTKVNGKHMPYIIHPVRVAKNASEAFSKGLNLISHELSKEELKVVIACLFHDIIEDTPVSFEEIKNRFGYKIASIVVEVTDDKSLPKVTRKQNQLSHSKSISDEAKIVKLCDMIDNLNGFLLHPIFSEEETKGYFVWKFAIFNNIKGVNSTLEDKAMELFKRSSISHLLEASDEEISKELESYYEFLRQKYSS